MAGRKSISKSKKTKVSSSTKAGLQWRLNKKWAKASTGMKIQKSALIKAAASIEYICAEVLELTGNAAKDNKRSTMKPRHMFLAIRNDEELNKMIQGMIPQGGVIPGIQSVLLKKQKN